MRLHVLLIKRLANWPKDRVFRTCSGRCQVALCMYKIWVNTIILDSILSSAGEVISFFAIPNILRNQFCCWHIWLNSCGLARLFQKFELFYFIRERLTICLHKNYQSRCFLWTRFLWWSMRSSLDWCRRIVVQITISSFRSTNETACQRTNVIVLQKDWCVSCFLCQIHNDNYIIVNIFV